jgi:polyhydroxyalkanoate synthesis regulator phasin
MAEDLKAEVDKSLAYVSRQMAHAVCDLDADIERVAREADRRLKRHDKDIESLQRRVSDLEGKPNGV